MNLCDCPQIEILQNQNPKPNQINPIKTKTNNKSCDKDVIESTPHSPAGTHNGINLTSDEDIRVRKYGEVVYNTLSSVASVLEYPKGMPTAKPTQIRLTVSLLIQNFISVPDLIKDSARPSYWVKDSDPEAKFCCVCTKPFGTAEDLLSNAKKQTSNGNDAAASPERLNDSNESITLAISPSNICDRGRHHCRSCGQAVCDYCSQNRKPVPERGWPSDVRVCDICYKKTSTP